MTPKEKALHLAMKLNNLQQDKEDFLEEWKLSIPYAKKSLKVKCLICVDEILNLDTMDVYMDYTFWNEVKQEIEKL